MLYKYLKNVSKLRLFIFICLYLHIHTERYLSNKNTYLIIKYLQKSIFNKHIE